MPTGKWVRLIFVSHYGLGPWPCFFCGKPVRLDNNDNRKRLNVHHRDGNKENNRKSNLKPSHHSCHSSFHHPGKSPGPLTEAGRKRIQEANLGKVLSAEHRSKISKTLRERYAKN